MARCWILRTITLEQAHKCEAQFPGVYVPCQHESLGDIAEGCCNGLTAGLLAATKSATTDSGSESQGYVFSLVVINDSEVVIEGEMLAEQAPIYQVPEPGLDIHCCIGNRLPQSVELTRKLISDVSWILFHNLGCDVREIGDEALKRE